MGERWEDMAREGEVGRTGQGRERLGGQGKGGRGWEDRAREGEVGRTGQGRERLGGQGKRPGKGKGGGRRWVRGGGVRARQEGVTDT
jgi:hypothetical protein